MGYLPDDSQTSIKLGSVLECLMTPYLHAWSFNSLVLPRKRKSGITSKKATPPFRSPTYMRSHTRMENQEVQ